MSFLASASLWLADATTAPAGPTPTGPVEEQIDPVTGHGPEWGSAAPIGLLVILLLCVAGYLLARSMSKRVRNVPASFDSESESADGFADEADSSGSAHAVASGDPEGVDSAKS